MKKIRKILIMSIVFIIVAVNCGQVVKASESIPSVDGVALGIEGEIDHEEWSDALFYYQYDSDLWEDVFSFPGTDLWVVRCGTTYMLITFSGPYGPVWSAVQCLDIFWGITERYFVFKGDCGIYAIDFENQEEHALGELPEQEIQEPTKVSIEFTQSARIDAWRSDWVQWKRSDDWGMLSFTFTQEEEYGPTEAEVFLSGEYEWYHFESGNRCFLIQKVIGYETLHEAIFVGGMNKIKRLIVIPFDGEFLCADEHGILYVRNGKKYFRSFFSVKINGRECFPEVPACILNLEDVKYPRVVNVEGGEESQPVTEATPF